MKHKDEGDLRWVGVDLHVHTPASKDYRGSIESSEFLAILRKANEFGSLKQKYRPGGQSQSRNQIGCVVFTDHASVDGFKKLRELQEETDKLCKALKLRDASNPLTVQLESELDTFKSTRVLMGVELKADPGIHVLLVFAESVDPSQVESFLADAYGQDYRLISGDPKPGTRWSLKETLDNAQHVFGENAFGVFPHADSSGGVYEDLKDFPTARIGALTHPFIGAVSFNKSETRDRIIELAKQPDYKRDHPLAYIQSSDFHGAEGTTVGEPRTDVLVREGKPNYRNLKEALQERRVKCSIDFVVDEYNALTEGVPLLKLKTCDGKLAIHSDQHNDLMEFMCGCLNSKSGIVEIEGCPDPEQTPWETVRDQIIQISEGKLEPLPKSYLHRVLRTASAKVRVLVRVRPSGQLHTLDGKVYVMRPNGPSIAKANEIEFVVSRNIDQRFGPRLVKTLRQSARESRLLARMPYGISLFLSCQTRLERGFPKEFKITDISPPDRAANLEDVLNELKKNDEDEFRFGRTTGNTSALFRDDPYRYPEHYHRFIAWRTQVDAELLNACKWGNVESNAIGVTFRGAVFLIEPGAIITDTPCVMVQVGDQWLPDILALVAWFKSSFFVWYCAVHLGDPSCFMHFQFNSHLMPIPRRDATELIDRLKEYAQNIVSEEKNFVEEINKRGRRGDATPEFTDKLINRHNQSANRMSLSIDKQIYTALSLSKSQQKDICETLRDLGVTDYGLADELSREE